MKGRFGLSLGARISPALTDYGFDGDMKYWVTERFEVKPSLNFDLYKMENSPKTYSFGASNMFMFAPWIGKHTRFNIGFGLGFAYRRGMATGKAAVASRNDGVPGGISNLLALYNGSNSEDDDYYYEDHPDPKSGGIFTFFIPVETSIEYHIQPWLSWEIGLGMDLLQVRHYTAGDGSSAAVLSLDSTRLYTGITMYLD